MAKCSHKPSCQHRAICTNLTRPLKQQRMTCFVCFCVFNSILFETNQWKQFLLFICIDEAFRIRIVFQDKNKMIKIEVQKFHIIIEMQKKWNNKKQDLQSCIMCFESYSLKYLIPFIRIKRKSENRKCIYYDLYFAGLCSKYSDCQKLKKTNEQEPLFCFSFTNSLNYKFKSITSRETHV